jgi:isopentenyl phosphate kinase
MDNRILRKVFGNKYDNVRFIDGGGIFGDYESMKSYGEDDPNIGKAPRFIETQTTTMNTLEDSTGAQQEGLAPVYRLPNKRMKRSIGLNHLENLNPNHRNGEFFF